MSRNGRKKFDKHFASDTGDEAQVEQAKLISDTSRTQDDEDVKSLMQTSFGRRVLRRILSECRLYHSTSRGEDTNTSAFYEGRRSIGLFILSILQAEPQFYIMLQQEGLEEDLIKAQASKVSRDTTQEEDDDD